MKKRILGLAALLVLLVSFAGIRPVAAQEEEPLLQPVVDGLHEVLDGAQPLFDGLGPITEPLGEGLEQLIGELEALFTALQDLLAQAEPLCAVLGPVLEGAQPLIDQLQPLLDQLDPETAPEQLDFLDPVLAEVDALIEQALTLCAAEEEAAPETTTTLPSVVTPSAELPRTGGPALLVPAGLALGLAALLRAAANRRL